MSDSDKQLKVRLDKWLWSARLYKTRSLAQEMISGGKVHYNGQRCKPSRPVECDATITLRQGFDEKVIVVDKLIDKRVNASIAATVYHETEESISKREVNAANRKLLASNNPQPRTKPDKKQRRQIIRFKSTD
ncbi:ribosome-associated heat shock protein Hsp15 [Paraferrimonas haliotis]|uniref:Heat shock protein 15 n=1 Tax=Paraferrimonas haliotis TaxID=2013866 RepID=A0AA37TS12_9GAMM|nr:ribosome-associated heat shock protein Hsp15 [Paraferrimonas haliotis]GLS83476.1 heat shock protein 15 [Paraferrimonas haliotis]